MLKRSRRRFGKRDQFAACAVAWLDLLGYGSMLREARFDPAHPIAAKAVLRLREFHETVARQAQRFFPVMPINDGAVFFRDLSPRDGTVTYDFISRAIRAFQAVNSTDRGAEYPGARMVIAAGLRIRDSSQPTMDARHIERILGNVEAGEITARQGIYDAFHAQPIFGFVADLQANFAFTRAFLADHDGSRAGLGGPHCFIDTALLDLEVATWIRFDDCINWAQPGMSARFGRLVEIDEQGAGSLRGCGARTSTEVVAALRSDSGAT